jgi:hypothetical protein
VLSDLVLSADSDETDMEAMRLAPRVGCDGAGADDRAEGSGRGERADMTREEVAARHPDPMRRNGPGGMVNPSMVAITRDALQDIVGHAETAKSLIDSK